MTEYISREAALAEQKLYNTYASAEMAVPVEALLEIPAADVVAVVRCADCKHAEPWYWDKSRCFLWHETGIDVRNDGYCNYGERKDGGQEE